jgi:hypothetical protein
MQSLLFFVFPARQEKRGGTEVSNTSIMSTKIKSNATSKNVGKKAYIPRYQGCGCMGGCVLGHLHAIERGQLHRQRDRDEAAPECCYPSSDRQRSLGVCGRSTRCQMPNGNNSLRSDTSCKAIVYFAIVVLTHVAHVVVGICMASVNCMCTLECCAMHIRNLSNG